MNPRASADEQSWMTAVAVILPDLSRRVVLAIAATALALALAAPPAARAETYCVSPVSSGCSQTFDTKQLALEQANKSPGTDKIRLREGSQIGTLELADPSFPAHPGDTHPQSGETKVSGTSFFDDVTGFMLTWLPLIFMGIICLLIGLTMRYMPRTKPQEIKPDTSQSTRWDDVAGAEEAKDELREVVEFLRDPKRFKKLGANVPRGILLHGPPGTGKTLLAKAVANESKAKFYAQSASSFVEMFAGLGAARIRRLFREARKSAPAIIFIDELDAVGATRGKDISGEKDQTLNQLLVEMDGFAGSDDLVVIGASNLLDKLDPALLRPGRFDRQIYVAPPDLKGRLEILEVHSRNKPLHDVDLEVVARQTSGLTGADLANICNEAAIFAGRHRRDVVMMQDFDAALERVVAGMQSRKVMNDHEKRVIAFHEAGHALCGELLHSQDKTHRISIIPRGAALGYTLHLPDEDRYLKSKDEMIDRMVVLLGGRVAEHIVFGAITTGASNDLQRVYEISRSMVAEYGMGTQLGSRRLPTDDYSVSDATRRIVDEEQQELTDLAWRRAHQLIASHREALEALAVGLLENEVLERPTIERIMAEHGRGDGREQLAELPAGGEAQIAAAERLEP
jgi:cell division protease FtsH